MTGGFQLSLHAANANSQRTVFTINMPPSFLLWWIVLYGDVAHPFSASKTDDFDTKENATLRYVTLRYITLRYVTLDYVTLR